MTRDFSTLILTSMHRHSVVSEIELKDTYSSQNGGDVRSSPGFPPLESVTSPVVVTAAAAYYLNRKDQTLRSWACLENGPIRPLRVHGRLAWPVDQIRGLLGVA